MTIYNANNLNPECYVKRESSVKTWNLCSEIFLHTNEHSLTLPEELKQELWKTFCEESIINVRKAWENSVVKTYRAGADQELEACVEWLPSDLTINGESLRDARRPKPQNLTEQALEALEQIDGLAVANMSHLSIYDDLVTGVEAIRLALERLQELEKGNE